MAKKKEKEFNYLQMPLPDGGTKSRSVKIDWSGLNYRQETDSGCFVYEKNISVKEAPYLTPADKVMKKLDFGNIGTTWHTPETITVNPAYMTVDGVSCYGIDFGNDTKIVKVTQKSGNEETLYIETGEYKEQRQGDDVVYVKETLEKTSGFIIRAQKIYAKPSSSQGAYTMWNNFVGSIIAYDIADELPERQMRELNNKGVYYDDLGYIVKSLSAYKNLLFIGYYSSFEGDTSTVSGIGNVRASCMIYDADSMQRVKADRSTPQTIYQGDFPISKKSCSYADAPDIKACVFNALGKEITLASYKSTSDIVRKVLFFPQSYSMPLERVEDVKYKSGVRYSDVLGVKRNVLYPFAFIDSFTDKNIIYNVIENPACKIPKKSDLYGYSRGHSEPYQYFYCFDDWGGYTLSNNDEENASWILGYWKFNTSKNTWLPYGYDSETKKKTATLPLPEEITGTPLLKDACVYQSRLFGINDIGVYASAFGDYSKWTFDTADEYNESNAWMSLMTSDETQSGKPVAIKVYQDAVVVFCEKHMYEIRNKKNPFRIVDICSEGCISSEACCVVNGYLLFANNNGVRMYTGSKPKDIGYALGFDAIYFASCGTDGANWYLYCETDKKEHNLFVYNTVTGLWAEKEINARLISFAATSAGVFALDDNNKIYLINSKEHSGQEWACETDFVSGGTVDIRHVKKIQMLAEVEAGSTIKVHILKDDEVFDGLSEQEAEERRAYAYSNTSDKKKIIVIRAVPKKAANYRHKIRISGVGYSKVYQMDVTVQSGGELFNGQI